MAWFTRAKGVETNTEDKKSVPKGVWVKCDVCQEILYQPDLQDNLRVCPKCDHHFAFPSDERIAAIADAGSFVEDDLLVESADPLGFRVDGKRYRDRLKTARKAGGATDAYRAGGARIGGYEVEIGTFVYEFMGGSMGAAVGEKITRQLERALERRRPAIVFSASGGARMQEGILSLMQMARTVNALSRLRRANVPYISVLLNPTTGGVAASFAMLGDIIYAEPKAQIGFAGPRVIEQTIRQKLPEGFQRSEFLLEHGIIDSIVHRKDLRARLIRTLGWFGATVTAGAPAVEARPDNGANGTNGANGANGHAAKLGG